MWQFYRIRTLLEKKYHRIMPNISNCKVALDNQNKNTFWVNYLSRASLKYFLWTSNWKTVRSQSVEALSLPPCFFRKASNPFSSGYFKLPMNTTKWKEHKVTEHKDTDNVFINKDEISHMQKKRKRRKYVMNNGYVWIILSSLHFCFCNFL